ncbi:AAA domain-containing protein [Paenibacillus taihuensis]|uniref:AAA domain-containing protein n=1 Tax=Paenibacillus taihuensis TaxID=1156355 RepID=A0A3D9S542_9BACL|nr:AAA family ATPase [Paenibacillus taihuensis]REE84416.1 AAA domain-containing protein [Paenibacillus taihuensis]
MRLRGIHIDGFGKLRDRNYRFDAPVTIVYGQNEAGKSTMMGFIRTMLFGFASKGNPAERLEPVNGGRHGGRLFVENEDGARYILARYGEASSKINVRADSAGDGAALGADVLTQQQWERMFLGGVNERLFRELFAITLSELQAIGMLEGDELGKQLYHAGWNGGGAIAKTEKLLSAQLDSLYRPRGSTQQMNKLVKALEETETQLRQLEDGIAAYNTLSEELAEAEGEQAQVERILPGLREREHLLARAAELREIWLERSALLHEQTAIGDTPKLAANARSRWELIAAELHRVKQELDGGNGLADRQRREFAALIVDDELLSRKPEIESLMLSAENMNTGRHTLIELTAEARADMEAVRRLIAQISPEWTEASLRSFQSGVAEREAVRNFRAALQERERTVAQAEAELRASAAQLREADGQLLELSVGVADPEKQEYEIGLLPQTLEALRSASRQFEEAWHELALAQVRAQSGDGAAAARRLVPSAAWWIASGVTAAGAGLFAAAGWPAAAAAAGVLAAALAAPPLLRLAQRQPQAAAAGARAMAAQPGRARRGREPAPAAPALAAAAVHAQPLAAAQRRVAAALQQLAREPEPLLHGLLAASAAPPPALAAAHSEAAAAAQHMPLRGSTTAGAADPAPLLSRLRAAIDARQDELRASAGTAERARELSRRQARLRAQHDVARAAAEHAAEAAEAIAAKWRDWLETRQLRAELTTEAALESYDLAEQAQLRLQAYDRAASKAARLEEQLADYEQAVFQLAEAFPAVCYRAHGDATAALRLLQAELDNQSLLARRKEELQRQLADQEMQLSQQSRIAEELTAKQLQWFQAAHAANELEWLDALERSERLGAIENALFKLDAQLTAGLSLYQREQLESWYAEFDESQLDRMKVEAGEDLRRNEARSMELLEHIGRLRQRMEQLLQSSDRQRLTMDREQTTASLEQLVDRYAVLSVSMAMIRRTKRIMEEQRQPAVLREASRMLSVMSGGKYKRIWLHEEKQAISLETEDSRIVESIYLSRGTAEQLYLAMRLALAEEASSVHALPLILDDPLVNFDYGRLVGSAAVLKEIAERRQIILFTCHAHMRDALYESIPDAATIELSS